MLSRRAVLAWGAGSLVVVGAVAAALINELHGGWRWWVAAVVVVVAWAVGTGWLAYRAAGLRDVQQGAGSVFADRISGSVTTQTAVEGWKRSPLASIAGAEDAGGDVMGEGAVRAGLIGGDVSTRATLWASRSAPKAPPEDPGSPGAR